MGCSGLLMMEVQRHDLANKNGVVNKGQSVKVDTSYENACYLVFLTRCFLSCDNYLALLLDQGCIAG